MDQTLEEKKPSEIVESVKSDLKRYRDNFDGNRKQEERAYHGDIWKDSDGYRPYENHVFSIIETEVPILTDSMPSATVEVNDPNFLEQAKNLGKAVEWVQKNQSLPIKLPDVVRSELKVGNGYIHIYNDPHANNGNGEIKYEVLPWKSFYQSGETKYVEDASKVRIELQRTRSWLIQQYPQFRDKLKDVKNTKVDKENDDWGYETKDSGHGPQKRSVPPVYQDEDTLCLVKTFIRDYSLESISNEETDEELQKESEDIQSGDAPDVNIYQNHKRHIEIHSMVLSELYAELGLPMDAGIEDATIAVEELSAQNEQIAEELAFTLRKIALLERHIDEHEIYLEENPEGGRPKYKNNLRCIETVNDIVLYDGESKDDHAEVPVVPFFCYDNGTPYADGEIKHILDSQRMQAVLGYKEYKGLQRSINQGVEYNQKILDEDQVTNEDGAKYGVPEGENWAVRPIPSGQNNPQINTFQTDRIGSMQKISGQNEATQGEMPNPNASGVTVTKLQNQAIGRIRLKDRQNTHYSIKRLGKLTAALIIQHWTEERVLELETKGDESEQVIFNPLEIQDLEYEVTIGTGSMAGIDKDMFNALMLSFLNGGKITMTEFLQVAELPRKEKLLELVSQREDKDAQIEELSNQLVEVKGSFNPELLAPEEKQLFEQIMREKLMQQQIDQSTGAGLSQPELGVA